jgi:D-sedoheptulose 7-phosphate isomerase
MKFNGKEVGEYLSNLSEVLSKIDLLIVEEAIEAIMGAYEKEASIYIMGNGGSASTASHIVCDFNKGISVFLDKKFRFVSLVDSIAMITAISNDYSYEDIFKIQMEGRLNSNDIVIAISGSGNSKNVLKAVEYAKSKGNKVISLTGYDGGKLKRLSDIPIHANIMDMQKSEDAHMIILHAMAQIIARRMGHPLC